MGFHKPIAPKNAQVLLCNSKRFEQQTFGAHFCEVAVDAYTGEIRIRRLLAVCAAGRILNPVTARSQVIGGMVMGA